MRVVFLYFLLRSPLYHGNVRPCACACACARVHVCVHAPGCPWPRSAMSVTRDSSPARRAFPLRAAWGQRSPPLLSPWPFVLAPAFWSLACLILPSSGSSPHGPWNFILWLSFWMTMPVFCYLCQRKTWLILKFWVTYSLSSRDLNALIHCPPAPNVTETLIPWILSLIL